MKKLKLKKNRIYYLIGSLETGGAIATKRQYENGELSFAHLMADGEIKRFNRVIGRREDIKIIGEADLSQKDGALERVFDRIENMML